ncbi:MAG TPA: transposase, partial [Gammaproteobacteria bacterium]|nr:transposase [Gammaproteobacteria bacterium]
IKVMLASLDPLGLPLATLPVAGNKADDELYLPAITEARKIVGCGGRLYVGDAKLSSRQNRAVIDRDGDYYLAPLAMTGEVPELKARLLKEFLAGQHAFEVITKPSASEEAESPCTPLALGFEVWRAQQTKIDGKKRTWKERALIIYSKTLAKTTRRTFARRLQRAEQELLALTLPPKSGRRCYQSQEELSAKVQQIVSQHRVEAFFSVGYEPEVQRRYVRTYKDCPPRYEQHTRYVPKVQRNHEAIRTERISLGWRLYATNAPQQQLPFAKAFEVYRAAPSIERNFARLKGKSLGIGPLYVQREDHVKGMVRLLSLALRVLTVVEYVVRLRLARLDKSLSGLYAGNTKRQTQRPTTERLLKAFCGITLTVVKTDNATVSQLTPLTPRQQRIIRLMGFSKAIYMRLTEPNGEAKIQSDGPKLPARSP